MSVSLLGGAVAAGLTGALAHELTHYATARCVGRQAVVDVRALETRYERAQAFTWQDRLIRVAPVALGLAVGLVAALGPLSLGFIGFVGWGVYTLGGIPNDVLRPETYDRLAARWGGDPLAKYLFIYFLFAAGLLIALSARRAPATLVLIVTFAVAGSAIWIGVLAERRRNEK